MLRLGGVRREWDAVVSNRAPKEVSALRAIKGKLGEIIGNRKGCLKGESEMARASAVPLEADESMMPAVGCLARFVFL
jgi:hypothetical protein